DPAVPTSAMPALSPGGSGARPVPARRTTDEVEAPPPRRGPAILIGLIALAATVLVVFAQLNGVPPLALVQRMLDVATGSSPPAKAVAASPAPPMTAPPAARPPPLPAVTTSELPPRVGSMETPPAGERTVASTTGSSPSSPAH